MKTIIRFLIWGLLLFPLCASAQKAAYQKEYYVNVEWAEMQGYSSTVLYKVPIYYDEDDNPVKHGPLKINYKEDLTSRVRQKCILAYNVKGNYVNGKLNGALSIEQVIDTNLGSYITKGTLNFVNGIPNGVWTFSQLIKAKDQTESYNLAVTIKDNKLVSYNKNDGKGYFEIFSDGTFSGKLGGNVYKNCVNTSELIRKTGETTELDETAQSLINAFIAGTMSESDLLAKGYAFKEESWVDLCNTGALEYYISILSADHFMKNGGASVSVDKIIKLTKYDKNISPAHTLKRVNILSAEELISKAEVSKIKTAYSVNEGQDYIHWGYCTYYYNTNKIKLDGTDYYFTEETKLKFEEAIKAALKERRLEEKRKEEERIARIAEEERLAKERRLQRLQPICDYLVTQKTKTSISFNDHVYDYFNPNGLDNYWRLDLEKAIKPFCKIVACKVVSCELQGDKEVAVFDITKYNKKGNITYRLPVVIVKDKILVTSIDISNATVVE